MAKALYLDSIAGVAGDMFTAAFVDAGLVSVEELNSLVSRLGISGVEVVAESIVRATIRTTRIRLENISDAWKAKLTGSNGHSHRPHHHHHSDNTNLVLDGDHSHEWHAHYSDIDRLLADSSLDDQTKDLARAIFRSIGEAESYVHGIPIEKAAFHEIGAIDSILDVVMAAHCIVKVAPHEIFATPIKPGRGSIKIAHGLHRVPPPASARLLIGMPIEQTPDAIERENVELSTPTGISIIKVLSPTFVSEQPGGILLNVGRGSGSMDLGPYPNIFQISFFETAAGATELPYVRDAVIEIACNIDDDTAERIGWLCEQLLHMGALDVWQAPVMGKKGRSSTVLSVLSNESDMERLADYLLRKSTTFGIRYRRWDRLILERDIEERDINGRRVRFKIGRTTKGEVLKEKPEFDDLKDQ